MPSLNCRDYIPLIGTNHMALPLFKHFGTYGLAMGPGREASFGQHLARLHHINRAWYRDSQCIIQISLGLPLEISWKVSITLFLACCYKGICLPALISALVPRTSHDVPCLYTFAHDLHVCPFFPVLLPFQPPLPPDLTSSFSSVKT